MDDEKLKEEFPGNSYTNIKKKNASNLEDAGKKVSEKTDKGRVREKKKTVGERIADSFIATDKEEIREHFIFDWLIPGIKTIVEDVVHMLLYGADSSRRDSRILRDRGNSKLRRIAYDEVYGDIRRRDDAYIANRGTRRPELTFNRRSDAEQVLSGMCEYIDDYGRVTMKEFYNIVFDATEGDIAVPTSYTQTRYGWTSTEGMSIIHVRDGYLLKVPRAEVIEL